MDDSDGPGKLEEVKELLADLRSDGLSDDDRFSTLEEIKIHGRDPAGAEPIFEPENINLLSHFALDGKTVKESREATRVLANAMLLKPHTRRLFVDLNGPQRMLARPNAYESIDDEFLCSRILFLLTYDTPLDFDELVREHRLAELIAEALTRHQRPKEIKVLPLMREMALSETLKLLFNLTHFFPQSSLALSTSSAPLFRLLKNTKASPLQPLQPPITQMLNALMNLEFTLSNPGPLVIGDAEAVQVSQGLIKILDEATQKQTPEELDTVGVPLVTVMRKLYEASPPDVQLQLQSECMPSEEERSLPLGQSESLPSRLLRLSVAAACPNLGIALSFLLFTLSDSEPETFVRNVGFGFASGFLVNNRLPIPHAGGDGARSDVNFVTGQFLTDEEPVPEVAMSDDEKEREAERLFVLFERLKATGVVDVENPVRLAAQEGRLREVDEEEDEGEE